MKSRDVYLAWILLSAVFTGSVGRLIRRFMHARNWKPSSGFIYALLVSWLVFDDWNCVAQRMSGFNPAYILLWSMFVSWTIVTMGIIASGTGTTFREFLWEVPEPESKLISLGLARPNEPPR
jgi:hypothetical protein